MHNDEFESDNTHSGHDSHKSHKSGKKHHAEEDDHPHKRSRDKQRTTAIALSVITCLFMCVIGYEIIRENNPKHDDAQSASDQPRPSLILSKMSISHGDLYTEDAGDDDTYENHQIRLLQDQNRKQANKIKALRQELVEKMQAMHEIKANLFKQEGDPRDKAKIADLSQKLEEKERAANNLSTGMKALEAELVNLQRKIDHSEVTRDALAAMIENQRVSKENERLVAEKQINELQRSSAEENAELRENILELEKSLVLLDNAYREKVEALEQVNQDLADQYDAFDAKTQEHQTLSELYQQTRDQMTQQILDLIAGLEWEATSKARITNDLLTALEKQHLEKTAIINVLETELQKRNEIIAAKEAEENLHRNPMGYTANQAQDQLLDLVATLEFEMTRTSFLQGEMDRSIYLQRQNLGEKAAAINTLEHDLRSQRVLLEKKGEELENLVSMLGLTRAEHHERITDLVNSHQYESLRAQQIEQELLATNQTKESLLKEHDRYRDHLHNLQLTNAELTKKLADQAQQHTHAKNEQIQELEQIIADLKKDVEAKDTLLAARQLELHSLMTTEAQTIQQLRQQAAELAHQIEAGNVQLTQLHQEIVALLPHKENEGTHLKNIKDLEDTISSLNQSLKDKEMQIAERQTELQAFIASQDHSDQQLRSHINQLSFQLEADNERLAQVEEELQNALQYKDAHAESIQKLEELQQVAEAFRTELLEKETQLEANQTAMARLSHTQIESEAALKKQIAELSQILDQESTKLVALERELQQALTSGTAADEHTRKLNAKLTEALQQATQLEEKLNTYHSTLTDKEKEIEALVEHKTALEQSLNEQIDNLQAQISNEQHKAETLQRKYQERHTQHAAQSKQLQEHELQVGVLSSQLLEKERELLATEEKLLLALPQLDMLTTENQHLHNSHGEKESKLQEASRLIHEQQQQLKELVQRLEEEQKAFKQTIAKQEEQRRYAQQAAKKLEVTALRAALLEDQLTLSNATLRRHEEAIASLEQSQVVLKDDYEQKLDNMRITLDNEKEHAREIQKATKELAQNSKEREQQLAEHRSLLEESANSISQLEGEIESLKEKLAAKNQLLQQKESESGAHRENEAAIARLKDSLEAEIESLKEEIAAKNRLLQQKESESGTHRENEAAIARLKDSLEAEIETLREKLAAKDRLLQQKESESDEHRNNEASIAQLKQSLENERQKNKAVEADLKKVIAAYNLDKQKESESSKQRENEEAIAQLKKSLENERQKNKAIEADLKKVITAYNLDKQKLKDSQKQPIAENNVKGN